jgi:hypothetical protein
MKRLLLATVAVLGLAGTGHAFTNQAVTPINQHTHLECVPAYERPRDHDRNPVYKIMVDLQLNGQQVSEIDARHVLVDGTVVDRNDQYANASVWQNPGYNEWYWSGTLMRNPHLTMNGRLYRDARGQWVYEETLFDRGRQNFYMASVCHVEPADPLKPQATASNPTLAPNAEVEPPPPQTMEDAPDWLKKKTNRKHR